MRRRPRERWRARRKDGETEREVESLGAEELGDEVEKRACVWRRNGPQAGGGGRALLWWSVAAVGGRIADGGSECEPRRGCVGWGDGRAEELRARAGGGGRARWWWSVAAVRGRIGGGCGSWLRQAHAAADLGCDRHTGEERNGRVLGKERNG